MINLSIIIVTYNSSNDIEPCLDSIFRTQGNLSIEIFVVDNASYDGTVNLVKSKYNNVKLIANSSNIGFPNANNQAIQLALGEYIMLLNPDTVVLPGAISNIVQFISSTNDCGVCGPTLINVDGKRAEDLRRISFVNYLKRLLHIKQAHEPFPDALSGACMVFRKDIIQHIGLLDENLFWCEDIDFCYRVKKKGYKICKVANSEIIHKEGNSAKTNLGLALEKQYISKINLLIKHNASQFEMRCIVLLFMLEIALRILKWRLIGNNASEARIRILAFKQIISKIMQYFFMSNYKTQY